jgi:alpha-galactosidase
MPDAVNFWSGNQYIALRSSDKETWTYRDMIVRLKSHPDSVSVSIQCPSFSLLEVQISWNFTSSREVAVLGDHWERTYGDVRFEPVKATKKLPWYCIEHKDNDTFCFGVKTGGKSMASWRVSESHLDLNLDTGNGGNGVVLGSRTLQAAEIITTKNESGENVFATVRRFCRQMCDAPRMVAQPVYGINDWYFAYGNNSADLILQHTALMVPLATNPANMPFSVIDAGWAKKSPLLPDDCCWGDDFMISNNRFGDMQNLAFKIRQLGMRPGLWTRPLCARHDDPPNLLAPGIANRNDSKMPILDPTINENLERIRKMIQVYRQWGFELVKHDYTSYDIFGRWGFEMGTAMTEQGWNFSDRSKTNAEIILHLYSTIREAAGDQILIGCNTVSHLSAGLFELNRIGDDTSGKEWSRTLKMGVNTMGFRMAQHKNFYEADGDCVGLTSAIPWNKNKQWMELLAKSSAPLFISAQPEAVGTEQKQFMKKCFEDASRNQPIGEPLDWLENPFPSKWKLDNREIDFDWS